MAFQPPQRTPTCMDSGGAAHLIYLFLQPDLHLTRRFALIVLAPRNVFPIPYIGRKRAFKLKAMDPVLLPASTLTWTGYVQPLGMQTAALDFHLLGRSAEHWNSSGREKRPQ
jgi:hypothetical protein